MGINQCIGAAACKGSHERIGDADGQIEIRHFGGRLFQFDEVENVRVVDTEDAHIRTAPGPALFNDLRREVEKRRMKEIGPEAMPLDDATRSLRGRR